MLIKIEDINDERLDMFYRTNERQLRHSEEYPEGLFLAESTLVIHRALDKGYEPVCFLISEGEYNSYSDVFKRCRDDITVYEVREEIFKSLKGYILIKGILGCFKRKNNPDIKDILDKSKRVVVLENVENPANVGSIFRNAAALFCDGVILTEDCSDPLYKRSIRVSRGNVFNIDWCYEDDSYLDILKENGFKTVSFALRNDSVDIGDEKLISEEKLAIIMGSEGYGLNSETINRSDYVVKIAMNPSVDSLNVASASGIALYELCKNNRTD